MKNNLNFEKVMDPNHITDHKTNSKSSSSSSGNCGNNNDSSSGGSHKRSKSQQQQHTTNHQTQCVHHKKKFKFICLNCNEVLCSSCIIEPPHRGHTFDDTNSIASMNSGNHYSQRLSHLWLRMKQLGDDYETFMATEQKVSEFYRILHEFLRVEEQKTKKPIKQQREITEKTIESILNEIKSINDIILELQLLCNQNSTTSDSEGSEDNNNNNNNNRNKKQKVNHNNSTKQDKDINIKKKEDEEEVEEVVQTRQEQNEQEEQQQQQNIFKDENNNNSNNDDNESNNNNNNNNNSIDIDIDNNSLSLLHNQTSPSTNFTHNDVNVISISTIIKSVKSTDSYENFISDNQLIFGNSMTKYNKQALLSKIQQYSIAYKNVDYKSPLNYEVVFDNDKLLLLKEQIQSVSELVDKNSISRSLKIFSIGKEGSFVFDPSCTAWSKLESDTVERKVTLNSVVSVGEYVYIFGGKDGDRSPVYSRYSLNANKWTSTEITRVKGQSLLFSVCSDGNNSIYLVGCSLDSFDSPSFVYRFDIHSTKFTKLADIKRTAHASMTFFHKNHIYIFNGLNQQKSIMTYDVQQATGETKLFIPDVGFGSPTVSCCYDELDHVYILERNYKFYRVSLSTKETTELKSLAFKVNRQVSMMIIDSILYLIGGNMSGNYKYGLESNEWELLNDDDKVDRFWYGACIVKLK
ncbi:hypothetical protein PPL_07041 [Heterostelium album PN500]|uniref:B box-type domain-containing protein n=1 Tax=Heterostelium pallidum (strain ATCC 26659 / Pp 5 / PN500) TaxID=670386 RepID=D3BE86_HETP5|nr:hypothetical protein PPL_07041 [Heterostelium album PN500]EFA80217.1 hypothetical protein PPL_07041 [Heterostelium album PN500]|eukprot:XP_020432337.1 hypothetical protein PPL_07041 [Heterostelium album PN500]